MKTRIGFVSNSSTTSFCLYGVYVTDGVPMPEQTDYRSSSLSTFLEALRKNSVQFPTEIADEEEYGYCNYFSKFDKQYGKATAPFFPMQLILQREHEYAYVGVPVESLHGCYLLGSQLDLIQTQIGIWFPQWKDRDYAWYYGEMDV